MGGGRRSIAVVCPLSLRRNWIGQDVSEYCAGLNGTRVGLSVKGDEAMFHLVSRRHSSLTLLKPHFETDGSD